MLAGARTGGGFNAKDPAWGACWVLYTPHSIHTLTETNVPVSEGSPYKESPLGRDEQASQEERTHPQYAVREKRVQGVGEVPRPSIPKHTGSCTQHTLAQAKEVLIFVRSKDRASTQGIY